MTLRRAVSQHFTHLSSSASAVKEMTATYVKTPPGWSEVRTRGIVGNEIKAGIREWRINENLPAVQAKSFWVPAGIHQDKAALNNDDLEDCNSS